MPSNRPSRPATRRTRVAGLRNRDQRPVTPEASTTIATEASTTDATEVDAVVASESDTAAATETGAADATEASAADATGTSTALNSEAGTAAAETDTGAASESGSAATRETGTTAAPEAATTVASEPSTAATPDAGTGDATESGTADSARTEESEYAKRLFGTANGSSTTRIPVPVVQTGPEPAEPDGRSWGPRPSRGLLGLLLVGTVLCTALAGWFGYEWYAVQHTGPAANQALASAGTTSEVNGQISDAVERLFSYDHRDTAATERAADELLVGDAVRQKYDELFAPVKQQAPVQQIVVTATVKNSAVTFLQDDRAEVLLFVDQHAKRAADPEPSIIPAQVAIGAEKHGDTWKVHRITLR
ncbi:hypothetical protein [Saccharopolyspora cebuensis]|uniref:Mce-associated membrane protein n=1 Tax=Saccharopolyspora cebuensis TaxID=418759 RepID=A0ABV4CQP1_9PSEU